MKLNAEQENALKYFIFEFRSALSISVYAVISSSHQNGIVNSKTAVARCIISNDTYKSTTEQSKYWFLCMSHKRNTRRFS